jgi:arylsulfatase A-like enzyme
VNHPLHWQVGEGPNAEWAVRDGDWKLIGNTRDTTLGRGSQERVSRFLVNLAEDPGETMNVADDHPVLAERLHSLHERHLLHGTD